MEDPKFYIDLGYLVGRLASIDVGSNHEQNVLTGDKSRIIGKLIILRAFTNDCEVMIMSLGDSLMVDKECLKLAARSMGTEYVEVI